MEFQNRTAIVTGGSGTLGRVLAAQLLSVGANVAIPYRSSMPEIKAPPDRTLIEKADVGSEEDASTFMEHVVSRFGRVDYLANIAGGYAGGEELANVSMREWEAMLTMNLTTAFLMSRRCLQEMKRQGFGRIVTIAAKPALVPAARKGPYSVSKRAVITLTETIAEETRGTGITANAIAPSIILTDENIQSMPDADHSAWVTPEEITRLILFLFADASRSISGNVIRIFGGV